MTAADVHQLTDDVRDKMLATLKEISTPSPEARIVPSTGDAEGSEDGEEQPLIGRSSGVYGSHSNGSQDEGMRRRGSSRGSSASSAASRREMVETGAVDARGLVSDLGEAVGAAGGGKDGEGDAETEDEIDETGAVLVKKP
jgi:hypothetical protein